MNQNHINLFQVEFREIRKKMKIDQDVSLSLMQFILQDNFIDL